MIGPNDMTELSDVLAFMAIALVLCFAIGAAVSWAMTRYEKGQRPPRERARIDERERDLLGDCWYSHVEPFTHGARPIVIIEDEYELWIENAGAEPAPIPINRGRVVTFERYES